MQCDWLLLLLQWLPVCWDRLLVLPVGGKRGFYVASSQACSKGVGHVRWENGAMGSLGSGAEV